MTTAFKTPQRRRPAWERPKSRVLPAALAAGCSAAPTPSAEVCELLTVAASQEEAARGESALGEAAPTGAREDAEKAPRELRGIAVNGLHVNGLGINGWATNGLQLNGLSINGFALNGLHVNGLHVNRLALNGLHLNGLHLNGLPQDAGEQPEVLEVLRYAAACALRIDQEVRVEVNAREITLSGALGVAPAWAERALDASEERWVTACMLAHANAAGEPVAISVRGSAVPADATEHAAFPVHEGAFFGSLDAGERFACQADPPAWARSVSQDRARRRCTDAEAPCGIAALGPCEDVCEGYDPVNGYHHCRAGEQSYAEVVNVYLREDALVDACAP